MSAPHTPTPSPEQPTDQTFKLEELASVSGVSPRTIRYYVQRGLLPAPQFRGRDTVYSEAHRARLAAIQQLQAQYYPLDVIAQMLHDNGALPNPPAVAPPSSRPAVTVELPVQPPQRWIAQAWRRYAVVPGLEIHLASDAGPLAHHLAAQWLQHAAAAAEAQAENVRT